MALQQRRAAGSPTSSSPLAPEHPASLESRLPPVTPPRTDLVGIQKSHQGVGTGAIFKRPTPAEILVASSSVSCCLLDAISGCLHSL